MTVREVFPTENRRDAGAAQSEPSEIDSKALLGNNRVVSIKHGTETYTLRLTRAGKLILTK
ncbi:MAG: hemin uptake protein HemP [Pseudomonadota bacterium]